MSAKASLRKRKLSREGLLLIKSLEGFRPRAVTRRDGVLTIGYGHTQSARADVEIDEAEAELLLMHDLIPIVDFLHTGIAHELNQHQFDALISFIFNIGLDRFRRSDVLTHLRQGRMEQAAVALAAVPDRKPPASDLPYRRRSAERALFETPEQMTVTAQGILLAPIFRPGDDLVLPAPEVPFGQTGVVRHEDTVCLFETTPHTPPRRRKKPEIDWQSIASAALLGGVGLMVGLASITAFKQGIGSDLTETHGALIGGGLVVLGIALIGVAIWAYGAGKRPTKATTQVLSARN